MADKFVRHGFDKVINVTQIITVFYLAFSKSFYHESEAHDFWEMVYIDRGEMICTADEKRFVLRSGEMTFHRPGEYHNLAGDESTAANVSIMTFACRSHAMRYFEGKIFRLTAEEKSMLSALIDEGLATYRLLDTGNPLIQNMEKIENAPFGSSQMVKNLLEVFLIKLLRHTDVLARATHTALVVKDDDAPYTLRDILACLHAQIYGSITLSELARQVGKSESTIKQLFARHMGEGVIRYYTRQKIAEAKRLIRREEYNMTQISDLLHFNTPQYFSTCFKAVTGMTPSEYRASIIR